MVRAIPAALAAIALSACGGGGGTTGDADAGRDADVVEEPSIDPLPDPAADPHDDPVIDAPGDPADDVPEDAPTDPGDDPVTDPAPDAWDVVADGSCPAMSAAFTSVESWVICWMGTGTAVSFTLRYASPGSACGYTNVTVTGGSLDLVSSASSIMTWSTTPPDSGFSGTVPAGGTASATYFVNDSTLDSSAHDGASVTVTVDLSYDTPASTETLSVTSSPVTHTCVY